MTINCRATVAAVVTGLALAASSPGETFTYNHESVLGTSLELRVSAAREADAKAAEAIALEEIDRLSRIFSTYDPRSEISQFLAAPVGQSLPVSAELADAFERSDNWTRATNGAFNLAVEILTREWQRAARDGSVPAPERLAELAELCQRQHWRLEPADGRVVRLSDAPLSLNAIAKGIILDRVALAVLERAQSVSGVLVCIGGDLRVAGERPVDVTIPRASEDAIGAYPAATLKITDRGVATSGNSERFFEIAGRRYSHIIDPRTGQPIEQVTSASIVAADAATADVLATACCVLPADEGLALVTAQQDASCLLQTADGRTVASKNWPGRATDAAAASADGPPADAGVIRREMTVEFEIARPRNSGRYRRPYVAIWIEGRGGIPVKTLSLFLMKGGPGPRWHRDLRRWYVGDQLRRMADPQDLIATISKPTRNPGQYRVTWDGSDDRGSPVEPGRYTLYIEAAREHGTYQLMKQPFEFDKSFDAELKPNQEISAAKIHYVAK